MLTTPPPTPVVKVPTKRAIAAKLAAEQRKARKLHAIAERRARAQGMDKQTFIAEIVKGNFRPITTEDIAAEPDPDVIEQRTAVAAEAASEAPTDASDSAATVA